MSDTSTARGNGSRNYNAAVDLLERNLVPDRSGRPYLRTSQRVWSYAEVAQAADAVSDPFDDLDVLGGEASGFRGRDVDGSHELTLRGHRQAHEGPEPLKTAAFPGAGGGPGRGERRRLSWPAPEDGIEIQGLLTLPREQPFPLIVSVHGGPVWGYRDWAS